MVRLLRDRFFALDARHGYDLATGDAVLLDNLPLEEPGGRAPSHLIEVLATAQDGAPRWVIAEARTALQASAVTRLAAAEARRRGFVPMLATLYQRFAADLAEDLQERALLLIASFTNQVDGARAALVSAAARSPRPHVLLTFHSTLPASSEGIVREARAVYERGSQTKPLDGSMAPDVARHVARADRAAEFQQSGRHAAAERLLREVAGTLGRRQAHGAGARVLMKLGRLLLDRGRAADADQVFEEAATRAGGVMDEGLSVDARLWQAAARLDAARLTEAESICRAILVAGPASASREAFAVALLGRILHWQGRHAEGGRLVIPTSESVATELEPYPAAMLDATASLLLTAAGDLFHAGLRIHGLLAFARPGADPAARIEALTAHLRLLSAAGDLDGAATRLGEIVELARGAHMPLPVMQARLVWHDALVRAGRSRDAQREIVRLARMRRVMPPLLRTAIERRARATQLEQPRDVARPDEPVACRGSVAAELVRAAYEEDDDTMAVRRLVDRLGRELGANRVELLSNDAGPVSRLIAAGTGLPTHLGARVLDAGVVLPGEVHDGGYEIGLPIRSGPKLVAALVCRWPIDRAPASAAVPLMELVAAIAAPRVDALVSARRDTARAATSIPALVGDSAAMSEVRRALERAARAPFAVLIEGSIGR